MDEATKSTETRYVVGTLYNKVIKSVHPHKLTGYIQLWLVNVILECSQWVWSLGVDLFDYLIMKYRNSS